MGRARRARDGSTGADRGARPTHRTRRRLASLLVVALCVSFLPMVTPVQASSHDTPGGFERFDADAVGHDWTNAYLLALLSHFVYPAALGVPEAGFEAAFDAHFTPLGLGDFDYIRDEPTDTEAMAAQTDDAIIITFRGTESMGVFEEDVDAELADLLDLLVDVALVPFDNTHAGFLLAASAVLDDVRAAIADAPGKEVWLTGHSLGGALATVTGWLLENSSPAIEVQGVATYGAPRVFLESRTTAYDDLVAGGATQRWVNERDPVPHLVPDLPFAIPPLPYRHVQSLNTIAVDGDGEGPAETPPLPPCTVHLDDTETDVLSAAVVTAIYLAGLAPPFGSPTGALLAVAAAFFLAGDLADHSMERYSARIFASMPPDLRSGLVEPPYPDPEHRVTACDEPQDTTPPVIVPQIDGTLGNDGWYVSDVTVTWDVSDPDSDVTSTSPGCDPTVIDTDTTGLTITCTASSSGGTASESVTVKRDATPPANVAVDADRPPDHNGWYHAPFTATWTGDDPTSGIAACTQTGYSGPDTAAGSLNGTCTDVAGNTSAPVPFDFRYDATPPEITIVTPPAGTPDYLRDQVVHADYHCEDATSGVASCVGPVADGEAIDTSDFGTHDFTVDAVDQAGNPAVLTHGYSITYAFDGFYQPIQNLPEANVGTAGRVFPFKWNLLDAAGEPVPDALELFEVGWSPRYACDTSAATQEIESTLTSGASGLRWDADEEQYVFTAASKRADRNTCRFLLVRVGDHGLVAALVAFR